MRHGLRASTWRAMQHKTPNPSHARSRCALRSKLRIVCGGMEFPTCGTASWSRSAVVLKATVGALIGVAAERRRETNALPE